MSNLFSHFTDFEALNIFLEHKQMGGLLITYRHCEGYEGMALAIMINFDIRQAKYELDLQWMSLGLDLYGDTLQESYVYRFESLEKLTDYLQTAYSINVTDIPVKYQFDSSQFPDPIKDKAKKPIFEEAWQRFQKDFKTGHFLDTSLKLVYYTAEE